MKRIWMIGWVSLALVKLSATAGEAPPTRALSLEDCIAIALPHNFTIQIARYNPVIARYTLAGSYGSYEPTLSLAGEHDYNLSPGGIDQQGRPFGGTETDTDTISAGIRGLLPWGLTYDLGTRMSDQWGTRPDTDIDRASATVVTNSFVDPNTGNTISSLSTNFSTVSIRSPFETTAGNVGILTLRQPLLKDFWIDTTRLTIFVNKRELKIKETDFRDQVMSTVTQVEGAYFNLIFAEENVRVQQKALELAERLLAENKRRVEVGALAPLDERLAESQAASSRADLLSVQAQRDTQQRVLKDLLSDDYTNEWAQVTILPTEKLLALPEQYDLQESWRKGLVQGPRLPQARLALEQQRQRVRFQRNQLFPQLDLIGSYGYNAGGSSREFSDAFGQIRAQESPFWSFGAQMSIPLGQTTARNNLKAAKVTQEQVVLSLRQQEQLTLIGIENSIASAQSSFERVDATRQARLYAEAALEAEQKKLENGKSTSFVVLELQKRLTDARSAEIRALADYNIALANLAFAEGSTLERRKIKLEVK